MAIEFYDKVGGAWNEKGHPLPRSTKQFSLSWAKDQAKEGEKVSLKGTPYYDMALDAGASKGDEAEQMAHMIMEDQQREHEMYKLIVRRHYVPHEFEFNTFDECAIEAIGQLSQDQSFPDKILNPKGDVVWEQDGPLGTEVDKLYKIADGYDKSPNQE